MHNRKLRTFFVFLKFFKINIPYHSEFLKDFKTLTPHNTPNKKNRLPTHHGQTDEHSIVPIKTKNERRKMYVNTIDYPSFRPLASSDAPRPRHTLPYIPV